MSFCPFFNEIFLLFLSPRNYFGVHNPKRCIFRPFSPFYVQFYSSIFPFPPTGVYIQKSCILRPFSPLFVQLSSFFLSPDNRQPLRKYINKKDEFNAFFPVFMQFSFFFLSPDGILRKQMLQKRIWFCMFKKSCPFL